MKLALIALLLVAACPAPQPPRPPTPLEQIEASVDLDGNRVGRASAKTVVVLMASWCGHCRASLEILAKLHAAHPTTRILGINYKEHEEYDNRGNAQQLRAYVAEHVPWLRVVPIDEPLFRALDRPPLIPTIWVYDTRGALVATFDRRDREPPTYDELAALVR
jgi:thiol-disulfide isomerase/thioredoxin